MSDKHYIYSLNGFQNYRGGIVKLIFNKIVQQSIYPFKSSCRKTTIALRRLLSTLFTLFKRQNSNLFSISCKRRE